MNNLSSTSIETAIDVFMDHHGAYFGELESLQVAEALRELLALREAGKELVGSFHITDQEVEATTDYVKPGEWPIDNCELLVYAAPEGWVIVPIEATSEMLNAAWISHGIHHPSAWRTMIAAAPKPEPAAKK